MIFGDQRYFVYGKSEGFGEVAEGTVFAPMTGFVFYYGAKDVIDAGSLIELTEREYSGLTLSADGLAYKRIVHGMN